MTEIETSTARSETAVRRGTSWKRAAVPLLLLGLLLALIAGVVLLVGDRMPPLTEKTFDEALTRWQQRGPASYDMDLRLGGARPGTVHVEVRNGVVTAFSRDGYTPEQQRLWNFWSVPGQFETIERELEGATNPHQVMGFESGTEFLLRAKFDPELGYPLGFQRVVLGGGPEVYWRVERFAAVGRQDRTTK